MTSELAGSGSEMYFPTSHPVQVELPALALYVPAGQTTQKPAEECKYAVVAASDRYFPASHEVQDADAVDAA